MDKSDKTFDKVHGELTELWKSLFKAGHLQSAASLTTAAYSIALDTEDEMLESLAVAWWTTLVTKRNSEKSLPAKRACSFCCKEEPDVRLAAGPDAFICNECITSLSDIT